MCFWCLFVANLFRSHLRARFFGTRGANRRLHLLHLFRWRQHGLHAERFDPKLSRPTFGVIVVLILLVLDFVVCFLEDLRNVTFNFLRHLTDQMPVLVVLCLSKNNSFSRDELGGAWFTFS